MKYFKDFPVMHLTNPYLVCTLWESKRYMLMTLIQQVSLAYFLSTWPQAKCKEYNRNLEKASLSSVTEKGNFGNMTLG